MSKLIRKAQQNRVVPAVVAAFDVVQLVAASDSSILTERIEKIDKLLPKLSMVNIFYQEIHTLKTMINTFLQSANSFFPHFMLLRNRTLQFALNTKERKKSSELWVCIFQLICTIGLSDTVDLVQEALQQTLKKHPKQRFPDFGEYLNTLTSQE